MRLFRESFLKITSFTFWLFKSQPVVFSQLYKGLFGILRSVIELFPSLLRRFIFFQASHSQELISSLLLICCAKHIDIKSDFCAYHISRPISVEILQDVPYSAKMEDKLTVTLALVPAMANGKAPIVLVIKSASLLPCLFKALRHKKKPKLEKQTLTALRKSLDFIHSATFHAIFSVLRITRVY